MLILTGQHTGNFIFSYVNMKFFFLCGIVFHFHEIFDCFFSVSLDILTGVVVGVQVAMLLITVLCQHVQILYHLMQQLM